MNGCGRATTCHLTVTPSPVCVTRVHVRSTAIKSVGIPAACCEGRSERNRRVGVMTGETWFLGVPGKGPGTFKVREEGCAGSSLEMPFYSPSLSSLLRPAQQCPPCVCGGHPSQKDVQVWSKAVSPENIKQEP